MADINNLLFNNPISSSLIHAGKKSLGFFFNPKTLETIPIQTISTKVSQEMIPLYKQLGKNLFFIRLASINGSSAVILGAFGSHRNFSSAKDSGRDLKAIFETANRYHFYHTFALMLVPLTRRPLLTGSLMLTGMTLFCGTCYYSSLTDDQRFNKLAPIGGLTLILAWLSMAL